ncbi:MAG: DUF2271 domain-containing protein [Bryobacteraceae bacterium]
MRKRVVCGAAAVAAVCLAPYGRPVRSFAFHHENVLGTSVEIEVSARDAGQAAMAESAALGEIDRCAKILSAWDASSEFSRWMRTSGEPVAVSRELFDVLALFEHWRAETAGALDPAAEAVTRLWKASAAAGRVPTAEERAETVALVRQTHYRLDPAARTATRFTAVPLALNSFAKSYIAARAADAATDASGGDGVMIDIGGDIVLRGSVVKAVGIRDPRDNFDNAAPMETVWVRDRAVATSGDYKRGVEIAGRRYSHIVDPRTAEAAGAIISSTVVAPDASTAGALATAFSVMQPEESARVAAANPGTEYLLVAADGRRIASPGWGSLRAQTGPAPSPLAAYAQAAPGEAWNTAFELAIQFELARIDDRRYRRPYVAVWIEDKDRFPVRTLALWYEKPRWLPDLKSWSHSDRLRSLAEGNDITGTVSSATRPPGKYSLKWDGKDNAGKLVKSGRYTVLIEAAREHGTYQVMRSEMDFAGTPKQVTLAPNPEVASAVLDYRKTNGR